jgi:arsenical pump membrane protein
MLLPELAAVVVVVLVLLIRFRRPLSRTHRPAEPFAIGDRWLVAVAAGCCLAVAPAALAGLPPWQAALPAALVLAAAFALRRRRSALRWSLVPWRVVLLTEGLFLVVATAGRHGLDHLLSQAAGHGVLRTEVVGAATSNLVNNLPAYLALERAVPAGHQQQLLGLLLGTNAGPMLLVTGSLATVLWRERCRARGVIVPAGQFLRLGLLVTPPLLLATYGGLLAG